MAETTTDSYQGADVTADLGAADGRPAPASADAEAGLADQSTRRDKRKKHRTAGLVRARDLKLLVKKPQNAGEQLKQRVIVNRLVRWIVQIAFLLLFPSVWNSSFAGVKYVFTQLGLRQPIELSAFVTLLLVVLLYTIVFGRFFCGYACSFGTLGDLAYAAGTPVRKALGLTGRRMPTLLRQGLQYVKYGVLVAICALCLMGTWSAVSGHSPWTVWGAVIAGNFAEFDRVGLALLIAIIVVSMFSERFFCQFLCPMGAVFSLMPVLPPSLFNRNRAACRRGCNRCQDRCPVGIHPDSDALSSRECIACGRCADACPAQNVTVAKTGNRWRVVRVVAKAAVLLVLLYLFA